MMKIGANVVEQKKIARYLDMGHSAQEISQMLYIREDVVKAFTPAKQDDGKKKTKVRNTKMQEEHAEIMESQKGKKKAPEGKPTK